MGAIHFAFADIRGHAIDVIECLCDCAPPDFPRQCAALGPCGFPAFTQEATHFAKELVALQSDVILTQGTLGTAALKRKCSARTAKVR